MKQKIVKGPRKPPRRAKPEPTLVVAELCPCNIEDFEAWVMHNLSELSHLFVTKVIGDLLMGIPLPPFEAFQDFCIQMRDRCQQVIASVESQNTTLH